MSRTIRKPGDRLFRAHLVRPFGEAAGRHFDFYCRLLLAQTGQEEMMLALRFFLIFASLFGCALVACGSDPDLIDGDADGDTDGDGDGDAIVSCGVAERLAYVTTDYTTGAAGVMQLDGWSSQPDLITLHSDAIVTCHCSAVVVLERLGGDNLVVLSPDGLSFVGQHSLGARSNPQDAWVDGRTAYVSLNGLGKVVAVDLDTGDMGDEVDLSSLADEDGNPEPAMMIQRQGFLYVALQLLDENTQLWDPTGPGLLAVVSIEPFELVGAIQLAGVNPATDIIEGESSGIVYIGHAGDWTVEGDGGIERVDLEAGETEGMVVGADELGGNILDFVIVDSELGYATVNIPNDRDVLVAFDPSSGTVTAEVASSTPYSLIDVILDGEGHLVLTDRAPLAPGLRVFDVEDGRELLDEPVETGIPPFSMCLLPELE